MIFTGDLKIYLLSDRIAFLVIYMPVLRLEIARYIEIWNNYIIRKQPKRPFVVTGKPYINYYFPGKGIKNFGYKPDPQLLEHLA